MQNYRLTIASIAIALAAMPTFAAQPVPAASTQLRAGADSDAAIRSLWTPEMLRSAKPLDLQVRGPVRRGHTLPNIKGPQQTVPGHAPTLSYDESWTEGLGSAALWAANKAPPPPLVGSSNIPYTTNRLYPIAAMGKAYPYILVGKLYFTINGAGYVCSASVIRRNVILTAGHCVNDGSGHYYANWMFIPAQNGSKAPYGTWTWADADTTTAWYSGGGTVPNAQDDALIVLNQRTIKHVARSVGDLTGWFGYEWNAALPTHITQLGYPCNLDSCADPIATNSQDTAGPTNNFQWGTYSFGGASGGPEVQDFGVAPSGAPAEILGGNIVVSATSYLYNPSSTIQEDGGSILWAAGQNGQFNFGDLINWACTFPNAC